MEPVDLGQKLVNSTLIHTSRIQDRNVLTEKGKTKLLKAAASVEYNLIFSLELFKIV